MPSRLCFFFSLALILYVGPTSAQPKSSAAEASAETGENPGGRALELGHRGLEAYQRREFRAALTAFSLAEELVHSPVFVLYQARCRRELGEWLQARELFGQAAKISAEEEALPLAWQRAQQDALVEWAALQSRIPRVRLVIQGGFEAPVRVSVGGENLELTQAGVEHEALPGEYIVKATDARGHTLTQVWRAEEAQRQASIALVFPQPGDGEPGVRAVAQEGDTPLVQAQVHSISVQEKGAYVAWGLGGAGLLYGTIVGAVALGKAQGVKSRCDGTRCLPADQAVADRAETLGRMATTGVLVGLVGAATGTVLFFTAPARSGSAQSGRMSLGVSGTSLLLKGEF